MSFIEIYFNSSLQDTIAVDGDSASIGRASYNPIRIDNKGVSSLHAVIRRIDKAWYIEDLNSTNGTYLNGRKIEGKQKIKFGDVIGICKHELKFVSERSVFGDAQPINPISDDGDRTIMVGGGQASLTTKKYSNCYLLLRGEKRHISKLLLDKDNCTIGKGKNNDIQIGGWFTPKLIAEITRIGNNHYLFPRKKKLIKLNGLEISSQIKLTNEDTIHIKELMIKFVEE
ncbi:MAG: hypothetical protein Kow0065_21160 [Methylomicrobium sp.]